MADRKAEGVEATNQAYIRYDQVHKDQQYHLAEAHHGEAFDDDYPIRTCDIARFLEGAPPIGTRSPRSWAKRCTRSALRSSRGTASIPGLRGGRGQVLELFTTRRSREAAYRARRHGSVNQGYFPIKETSDIHPDLVEGWVFCRRAFAIDGAGASPRGLLAAAGDGTALPPLCLAHERLILPVMQSLLLYLGCDPHLTTAGSPAPTSACGSTTTRRCRPEDEGARAGRLLGHEDVDMFTFLPAPRIEGLQVLNRANMKWVRLDAPPGSIILNTGDYVQRISNDRLPSTTHRVSPPRDAALRRQPRVSFPMAVYVWEDEVLEVLPGLGEPRYPPIKAIEFHTRTTSKFYGDDYAVRG